MEEVLAFLKNLSWPMLAFMAYAYVWLVSMVRNMGYRRLAKMVASDQVSTTSTKAVSIVLLYEGDEELLRQRLPIFLEQQYGQFEVILACATPLSTETEAYLQSMRHAYSNLQVVPLPVHVLYISTYNLVLTLGMRAARYRWVLLSSVLSVPASNLWLATMAAHIRKDKHLVVGMSNSASARGFAQHKYAFLHLWRQFLVHPWGRHHKLILASPQNLLLDKDFFQEKGGLAVGAEMLRGAVEIAVNRYTRKSDVVQCLCPEAFVVTDLPKDAAQCKESQLFNFYVWSRLRWSWWLDFCSFSHGKLTWWHSFSFTIAFVLVYLRLQSMWLMFVALVLMWLIHALFRDYCFHRSLRALRLPSMHIALPFMLHMQPFWAFAIRCRYRKTDKRNFRKRFV